jgi:hypothetical protein
VNPEVISDRAQAVTIWRAITVGSAVRTDSIWRAITVALIMMAGGQGRIFAQASRPADDALAIRLRPPERFCTQWWQGDLCIWTPDDVRHRGWQDLAGYSLSFSEVIDLGNEQSMLEFRRLKNAGVRVLDYMTLYHHPDAQHRTKEGWWEADHLGWYVVDQEGRFQETTFSQFRPVWLQTCVNHPAFVADTLRHVSAVMEAGADGIFVDHVTAMNRCFGPETHKHPHRIAQSENAGVHMPVGRIEQELATITGPRWEGAERDSDPTANAALVALLTDIKRVIVQIHPGAVLVINSRDPTTVPSEMWAVVDMVLFESFVTRERPLDKPTANSRWLPWTVWYESMLQCLPFLHQGKRIIAYSFFGRERDETFKADGYYAYCTAKLFDAAWGWTDAEDLRRPSTTRLGKPLADRPMCRDGIHYREYENGIVVVNPSDEARPFRWREPHGRRILDHYADQELTGGADPSVDVPPQAGRLFEYKTLAGKEKKAQ